MKRVKFLQSFLYPLFRRSWTAFTPRLQMIGFLMLLFASSPRAGAGNELLIKWRGGPEGAEAKQANTVIGGAPKRNFGAVGWQLVQLPDGVSFSEGLAKYRAHPDVLAVEANNSIDFQRPVHSLEQTESTFHAAAISGPVTPNDPRWSTQWNLRKIGMPAAWAVTTGSSNVVVAVLDTGVDYTHEDIRDNMWRNPGESGLDASGNDKATNGIDDDNNGYIDDIFGIDTADHDSDPMDGGILGAPDARDLFYHGTACAGIIAAKGNNSVGLSGVSWSSKIMALRIANDNFVTVRSLSSFVANVLEAFNYVIDQRRRGVNIRITNNSWGHPVASQSLKNAMEIAAGEGVLSVTAAGNESMSSDSQWSNPDADDLPEVINVALTDSTDQLRYSNYGRSTVDLAAPGYDVPILKTNRTYASGFGSSFAAPHVAAAAALLLEAKPDATPLELKAALLRSVDPISGLRGRAVSNGRLNVSRALDAITNQSLPPIVVAAVPSSGRTHTNAEIQLFFNEPMNRESVETRLQFNPPISGIFAWSDGDRRMRLQPDAPLARTNYTARLLGTARNAVDLEIDGDFDRVSEGTPADDFVWTFRFAPANDDFANATVLEGPNGSIRGSTANATVELNEPLANDNDLLGGLSLWYQWRAP